MERGGGDQGERALAEFGCRQLTRGTHQGGGYGPNTTTSHGEETSPQNTPHTRKAARQQWEARAVLVQCEREHV